MVMQQRRRDGFPNLHQSQSGLSRSGGALLPFECLHSADPVLTGDQRCPLLVGVGGKLDEGFSSDRSRSRNVGPCTGRMISAGGSGN